VIGERVRDKIAASKRKGLWVGGPVPLGFASVDKKLVVIPEEAETVRLIFTLYLKLGSVRLLAEELDRRGIRTKRQLLANGRIRGDGRFGVGSLANLLRNRFYIGEVFYRGEVYRGEHDPILERTLFEAVQATLAGQAAARRLRLKASSAILAGRIFDDRGNRMTPTHANKRGVRYRYYVSHALLQTRSQDAGSVPRIPAPDVERIILQGLHDYLATPERSASQDRLADRDLIDRHVDRIVIRPTMIEVLLQKQECAQPTEHAEADNLHAGERNDRAPSFALPWTPSEFSAVKGVLHRPSSQQSISAASRDALLSAIAKAGSWIDDLVEGRATSFAQIAQREGKVERHVRFLAPLAFTSPRLIAAIVEGNAPAGLTITALAKALPYAWAEQDRRIGLSRR